MKNGEIKINGKKMKLQEKLYVNKDEQLIDFFTWLNNYEELKYYYKSWIINH